MAGDERLYGDLACPSCGAVLDGTTDFGAMIDGTADDGPSIGDYSVCIYCITLLRFARHPFGLALRPATETEVAAETPTLRQRLRDMQVIARRTLAGMGNAPDGRRHRGPKWN